MAECEDCEGTGLVDCDHCGTAEAATCDYCNGTGEIDEDEYED